jgi:hypothetical protein
VSIFLIAPGSSGTRTGYSSIAPYGSLVSSSPSGVTVAGMPVVEVYYDSLDDSLSLTIGPPPGQPPNAPWALAQFETQWIDIKASDLGPDGFPLVLGLWVTEAGSAEYDNNSAGSVLNPNTELGAGYVRFTWPGPFNTEPLLTASMAYYIMKVV